MRYVIFKLQEQQKEMAYRIYITDSLQAIPQSKYLTTRFDDLINRRVDTRTGDEIAADIIRGAGLKIREEERA